METQREEIVEDDVSIAQALRKCLETEDSRGLAAVLEPLSFSDRLREILQLSAKERDHALALLPTESAAELINEAPNELAAELVERLEVDRAADIIEELNSDIQADLIGDLDEKDADAILDEMDEATAADVRRLASYDDDTAGGLMVAETFTFLETDTVSQVLRRITSDQEDFERYRGQHPYVLDSGGRPVGVVSLRALLTSNRAVPLSEVMMVPQTIGVDAPIDELREFFDSHPYLGAPVIESNGTLVGVVTRSSLDEAVLQRSEFQSLRRQGVVGDELRSMPLFLRSRRRLSWLSANILLNIIAASVIAAYEETLTAVIAIAVFLPMVSDMSGCSGNQAVGVSMRELTLGLIKPMDAFRVWSKEASVGIINGFVLGILIGAVAWLWKGNLYLGVVVGLALALNTVIAVSIGGIIPLALKRIGKDPAVASGPLLTTITDMAGFFLVLSLATAFMPQLTGP